MAGSNRNIKNPDIIKIEVNLANWLTGEIPEWLRQARQRRKSQETRTRPKPLGKHALTRRNGRTFVSMDGTYLAAAMCLMPPRTDGLGDDVLAFVRRLAYDIAWNRMPKNCCLSRAVQIGLMTHLLENRGVCREFLDAQVADMRQSEWQIFKSREPTAERDQLHEQLFLREGCGEKAGTLPKARSVARM